MRPILDLHGSALITIPLKTFIKFLYWTQDLLGNILKPKSSIFRFCACVNAQYWKPVTIFKSELYWYCYLHSRNSTNLRIWPVQPFKHRSWLMTFFHFSKRHQVCFFSVKYKRHQVIATVNRRYLLKCAFGWNPKFTFCGFLGLSGHTKSLNARFNLFPHIVPSTCAYHAPCIVFLRRINKQNL